MVVVAFGDKRTNRFPFLRGSCRAQGSGKHDMFNLLLLIAC